jgi:peptidylprolyl isomerase
VLVGEILVAECPVDNAHEGENEYFIGHRLSVFSVQATVAAMKNILPLAVFALLLTFNLSAQAPETPEDVAGPPADATCTDSGLCSKVLVAGTGEEHPDAWDSVTVHYSGWTTDGNLFDSSFKRGKPATFPLNRVIPGWTEGVGLMVEDEIRRFWIPSELAYNNQPGRPAGMLVFDVQLISIDNKPEPPPAPKAPEDVAAPPAEAERTPSGLASKILRPGVGNQHPTKNSTVTVHYSGWTTDGNLFDSSVVRGEPASFPLNRVIPGWTEGVQLMVVGERRRFWIPEKLAYAGAAGAPKGMLVFDVELIEIK